MQETPFSLRQAIHSIRVRKALVMTLFLAILGTVGAVTLLSKKYYASQAKLFVRLGRENIGLDPTATLGEGAIVTTPTSREAEITSVVHMIRSRDLFEEAVDVFGPETIMRGTEELDESDESESGISPLNSIRSLLLDWGVVNKVSTRERAVIKFSKKLSVEALDYSNVISVTYEAESPHFAQKVVTWVVSRYEERHVKTHRPTGAFHFMEQQAERYRNDLEAKEAKLEQFKIATGMISSDLMKQELVSRIAGIKSSLRDAAVEVNSLDSEVAALRERLASLSPTSIVSETRGAGNDGADGMRKLLYEQEMQLAAMTAKLTENHPSVLRLKDSVETAQEILAQVESNRTESVRGLNRVYAEIQIELMKKEPLLEAARQKQQTLASNLLAERKALETFSQNEHEFRRLTRELDLADANYRRYVRNLAQVAVDQSLEKSRLSNISVSQPASLSEKPVRPNKLINLIAGFILATFGSFGTAILISYFKSDTSETSAAPALSNTNGYLPIYLAGTCPTCSTRAVTERRATS